MDPIALAVLTAGATTLATKTIEGFGGEAGKDLWKRVKTAIGLADDPSPKDLAPILAERFSANEAAALRVADLLKENAAGGPSIVQHLVDNIDTSGGKVTVIGSQTAEVIINQ